MNYSEFYTDALMREHRAMLDDELAARRAVVERAHVTVFRISGGLVGHVTITEAALHETPPSGWRDRPSLL